MTETAGVIVLQATEGVTKETVLPNVDTLITSYLAHTHFKTALTDDLFLHGPLLSSIKTQSGVPIESDKVKSDEHKFLQYVLGQINSSISSWSEDHQLKNMLYIIQQNLKAKEKRKAEEREADTKDEDGDPNMKKLKNMKGKLKNLSKKAKSGKDFDEDKTKAKKADDIERAQQEKAEKDRKAKAESKAKEENMDCINVDVELAQNTASTTLHIATFCDEDIFPIEYDSIRDNYRSIENIAVNNAAARAAPKSKKASGAAKIETLIATNGSVKQEMFPTYRSDHVIGVTEVDAEISKTMTMCDGLGYGVMGMSGVPEWEEENAKTGRRADVGSRALKIHHEALVAEKKKLQALEAAIAPKKSDTGTTEVTGNIKEKGNEGTLLALYSALASLSSTLGIKKEAGLYINRFVNLSEKISNPHYQAIGCRMSLDFEEWVQSSAASYYSAKTSTRLKKLQTVLLNTKRFFGYASQCKNKDPELYFDAYKRLVNCYCDISTLPKEKSEDDTGNSDDGDEDMFEKIRELQKNLEMLTPQDIDDCEATDADWLREYSPVRARNCQASMSAELKEYLAEAEGYLNTFGIDVGKKDEAKNDVD